ncbi:hypothetical protein BDA96_08G100000 [Sorghum bicolor]|uniref:Uncharacterized protein n=1 Tax=Sorghum bicolor TaxID=4558 RepID=A0A921U7M1_SORBI|nr:hypothetical protein BDA96_08G100000 [Sorghum bicolor]
MCIVVCIETRTRLQRGYISFALLHCELPECQQFRRSYYIYNKFVCAMEGRTWLSSSQ